MTPDDNYDDEAEFEFDETETTAEEFDAMWESSVPVQTVVPTAPNNFVVMFATGTPPDVIERPSTSGSFDELEAPDTSHQTFEPRQPVLLG
ncbi:hypothetical protein ACTXG5_22840 [Mycobacterium sp. Dal123C01]|uniref:hypothetical protein n=1 Tax=Mycobacterium sp. Dal123C01 TaxID=3457577 RepID=UPI00403EDF46